MSYTYLLEQGEESSAGCFSDIPQSVLSNLNLTAEKSYSKDNETESCPSSQSGMMSAPSTENLGEEKSMSSQGVFPVKTSQAQEEEPGSQANEADYGQKWPESLAKFDPNTFSWRTHQCLLFEDLTECLAIFPRWGMMHDGELWEQLTQVRRTDEIVSGLWPTPNAQDHKAGMSQAKNRKQSSLPRTVSAIVGKTQSECGGLNPDWVEWLMGWPIGWTDLKPLEMDKFHLWLQQHGEYLEENK
jgi:hypothetical protein